MQPLSVLFPYDFLSIQCFYIIYCVYQYRHFFPGFNIGDNRDQVLVTNNHQFAQFSLNGDDASGNLLKDEVTHEDGDDNEIQYEEGNDRSTKAGKRTSSKMKEEEIVVSDFQRFKQNKENAPYEIGGGDNGIRNMVETEETLEREENEHLTTVDELDSLSEPDLENNTEIRGEEDRQNGELTDSLEY